MTGRRVAILDASLPFSTSRLPRRRDKALLGTGRASHGKESNKDKSASNKATSRETSTTAMQVGVLLPIPGFSRIIQDAVHDTTANLPSSTSMPSNQVQSSRYKLLMATNVVYLDTGLICDADAVEVLAPRIHNRILKSLAPP